MCMIVGSIKKCCNVIKSGGLCKVKNGDLAHQAVYSGKQFFFHANWIEKIITHAKTWNIHNCYDVTLNMSAERSQATSKPCF